jgi:hypothetical protein
LHLFAAALSPSTVWRYRGCAPGIGADAAAGEGLAGEGGDGSIRHAAGEGLIGRLKGDAFADLPEAGGEAENGSKNRVETYLRLSCQIANS